MHTNPIICNTSFVVSLPRFKYTLIPNHIDHYHNKKIKRSRKPSMEEIVSLIFHGCKLVKELEERLPNIANQPHVLISSCDEISRVFGNVREQLSSAVHNYGHHEPPPALEVGGGSVLPEWLRSSHAMDMVLQEQIALHQHHGFEAIAGQESGGRNVEPVATDVAPLLQRTRRRKHEADRRTLRVPAPRMGNTEVPTDDGYTWRKYGQKEILGSKFPRGYYRCTHQKLYNCPAKKQVQRLDNDPYTFEVTYRGEHTCTMSSTAPSMPPPPQEAMTAHSLPSYLPHTESQSLPQWLSMEINRQSHEDLYSVTRHSLQTYQNQPNNSTGAGPSSPTRYGDYQGVTDLVDTMFNSGSSSNNSMELIFSPNEEKKEGEEKTK
ncbi:DNA-binding WRKY [Artemisia annua]|uniref:DNA-binding WRKY n=1 Tax=Artemisia annua TaxID=35608 RepID=A0A2U1MUU1_ARTAN|nr:DNA-binding WRKY [Artemisia annua]